MQSQRARDKLKACRGMTSKRKERKKTDKRIKDITGRKFNMLTVLGYEYSKNGSTYWKCKCDCGNETIVQRSNLRTGSTVSCGCHGRKMLQKVYESNKQKIKHGDARRNRSDGKKTSRLYNIWCGMKQRCNNPNTGKYHLYGGKGVSVCNEWMADYAIFKDWALSNGYSEELTIDRIDNGKGYSPDNCRWADINEQHKNRGITVYIGISNTIKEWSKITGLEEKSIRNAYRNDITKAQELIRRTLNDRENVKKQNTQAERN